MQNVNYNLLKILHSELDNLWRIDKHYLKDCKGKKCHCSTILMTLKKDLEKHIEMLRREMDAHMELNKLA